MEEVIFFSYIPQMNADERRSDFLLRNLWNGF